MEFRRESLWKNLIDRYGSLLTDHYQEPCNQSLIDHQFLMIIIHYLLIIIDHY
jgi:hypothetical protein